MQMTVPPSDDKTVNVALTVIPRSPKCFFVFSSASTLMTRNSFPVGANAIGMLPSLSAHTDKM